jgi:uncharacterized protein YjiS (DUF1127 family)
MSIHFISPAGVEFTRTVAAWRRQPQARSEFRELSDRQLAELRWPLADISIARTNVRA